MRILVAGFQHETNTFAPSKADWAAFHSGAGYPELTRGGAMLERVAPTSLPLAGFLKDAALRGWQPVPSVWAGATPSALLATVLARGPLATHAERLPFLLPLNSQCTLMEPAAGLFADLAALEAQSGVHLSFAMGFPAADFPECGPVVFGHGADAEATQ